MPASLSRAVVKEFGLSDEEVPVMLITVGYPGVANCAPRNRVKK
ncbi:hypothetical protein [Pseudomonas sp. Q11]